MRTPFACWSGLAIAYRNHQKFSDFSTRIYAAFANRSSFACSRLRGVRGQRFQELTQVPESAMSLFSVASVHSGAL
ncbi:hypothetical protein H6F98_13435 [Microcoleus sp. FACHB-SPT15]|uniref:hypothetical protein n=1 Tax=Microcoleus sp. FACHB-SPT15 TaxID=2692830 RepID=UPI001784DAC1|nr:hypothetical protein [Microcoleus sp. FACHB-SPT15]MBD1806449.1 hypothetical protein [Microcoleus sp. FACHB-SPT15]